MTLLPRICGLLREKGLDDVLVAAGGIIPTTTCRPSARQVSPRVRARDDDRAGGRLHPGERPVARLSGQVARAAEAGAPDPAGRGLELAEGTRGGDRRALARLLTAVENRTEVAEAGLRRLHPEAGRAHLIGITGAPGAGKSTLVAALIGEIGHPAGPWPSSRSTPRHRSRAALCSAIGSACSRMRPMTGSHPEHGLTRACRRSGRLVRRRGDGARRGRLRPDPPRDGRDRPERGRGGRGGRHHRRLEAPRWATRCRRSRRASSRSPTSSS